MSLEVRDLGVDYGGGEVLRGVTFEVRVSEVLGVVGPNGAGKTSMMRAIMGFAPRSRGMIEHQGHRIERLSPGARARTGLGLVPDDRGLFSSLTVYEHLWLGCHRRPSDDQLQEVFALFPQLQDRRKQKAGSLSGGEAQMLAIAMVLLERPKTLLIDELSFGLAPKIVGDLLSRCRALASDEGIGIVIVEQFVELVLEIADRALVIAHGEIQMEGTAAAVRSEPDRLRSAYLG